MSDDVLYRSFEVRATDDEGIIGGVAVPFGQVISHGGAKETFARGAFEGVQPGKRVYYGHNHLSGGKPIGRIIEVREEEDGLHIRAELALENQDARETYNLVKRNILESFSVGFKPRGKRRDGDVTVYTRAELVEVSVVDEPAYSNAAIAEVRAADNTIKENSMENEVTNSEVVEIREGLGNLEREVNILKKSGFAAPAVEAEPRFRSLGEAVKSYADANTTVSFRDYTGGTAADAVNMNVLVPSRVKFALENRIVKTFFKQGVAPTGTKTVEYVVRGTKTGDVAEQALEGDDATFMKLTLDTATADIKYYHVAADMSYQAIRDTAVSALDATIENMGLSYANVTNGVVRNALVNASGVNALTSDLTSGNWVLSTKKAAHWLTLLDEAEAAIYDNSYGLGVDAIFVSREVFRSLFALADSGDRPVFSVFGNTVNTPGLIVPGQRGVLANKPVIVDPGFTGKKLFFVSREAITSWEDSGAPFTLTDDNIINLTRQFAVYGRMAVAVNEPKGIAKVNVT